jgi:hypothetical protein
MPSASMQPSFSCSVVASRSIESCNYPGMPLLD